MTSKEKEKKRIGRFKCLYKSGRFSKTRKKAINEASMGFLTKANGWGEEWMTGRGKKDTEERNTPVQRGKMESVCDLSK